jgi:predicted metal-dependent HD superfamily phosphohydrolase
MASQDWDIYCTYANNIRKEYSMYPEFLYKPGCKKLLHHFLNRDRIIKTGFFFNKFENKSGPT